MTWWIVVGADVALDPDADPVVHVEHGVVVRPEPEHVVAEAELEPGRRRRSRPRRRRRTARIHQRVDGVPLLASPDPDAGPAARHRAGRPGEERRRRDRRRRHRPERQRPLLEREPGRPVAGRDRVGRPTGLVDGRSVVGEQEVAASHRPRRRRSSPRPTSSNASASAGSHATRVRSAAARLSRTKSTLVRRTTWRWAGSASVASPVVGSATSSNSSRSPADRTSPQVAPEVDGRRAARQRAARVAPVVDLDPVQAGVEASGLNVSNTASASRRPPRRSADGRTTDPADGPRSGLSILVRSRSGLLGVDGQRGSGLQAGRGRTPAPMRRRACGSRPAGRGGGPRHAAGRSPGRPRWRPHPGSTTAGRRRTPATPGRSSRDPPASRSVHCGESRGMRSTSAWRKLA